VRVLEFAFEHRLAAMLDEHRSQQSTTHPMTNRRQDGLFLLVLASVIFVASGLVLARSDDSAPDFKALYFGGRCLLQHADPYNEADIRRLYNASPGPHVQAPAENKVVPFSRALIYFPSAILLCVPFACLAWGSAYAFWMILIVASFLLASFLAWSLAADYAPVLSACLIGGMLVNSFVLFTSANPAAIAVSLCIIAAWCFFRDRFIVAGVLCLALGLALKPHDVGFVWLCFLLAGGAHRKRVLQSLAIVAVLLALGSFWIWQVAPHWLPELRANLAQSQQHNQINDPSPVSSYARTASTIIDLQSVVSFFRNDPAVYNPISYLIVGTLLALWLIPTLRPRSSRASILFALAPIASLTMLPVYHRACDAKLLMLAVPACAMLIAQRDPVAWLALLANSAAIFLTCDIPLIIVLRFSDHLTSSASNPAFALLKIAFIRPAPFALLVMTVVNLLVYARRARLPASTSTPSPNPAELVHDY
jgi:hypothetical protein